MGAKQNNESPNGTFKCTHFDARIEQPEFRVYYTKVVLINTNESQQKDDAVLQRYERACSQTGVIGSSN